MDFEALMVRLRRLVNFLSNGLVLATIIEAACVSLLGVFGNNLKAEDTNSQGLIIISFIMFSAIYVIILVAKAIYIKSFPPSLAAELLSERKLRSLEIQSDRRNALNGYLAETIKKLNLQTCTLNEPNEESFCQNEVEVGIRDLLRDLIENTSFLMGSASSLRWTVGVNLDWYQTYHEGTLAEDEGIAVIQDDWNVHEILPKNLLTLSATSGPQLVIKQTIDEAQSDNVLARRNFDHNGNSLQILVCPIPEVCSDDPNGAIFFIGPRLTEVPEDLGGILKVYNQIIANWLSRYNSCITLRAHQATQQQGN